MQAVFDTVFSLLPYHLLVYGALLATGLLQCIVNPICYQTLALGDFIALQNRLFPASCQCQVGLAILTLATRPPYSIFSFATNLWGAVPLAIVIVAGAVNWVVFGSRITTAVIGRRSLSERVSDTKSTGAVDLSLFRHADRDFVEDYASSVHLNAIALIATVWYAFSLASSVIQELQFFEAGGVGA